MSQNETSAAPKRGCSEPNVEAFVRIPLDLANDLRAWAEELCRVENWRPNSYGSKQLRAYKALLLGYKLGADVVEPVRLCGHGVPRRLCANGCRPTPNSASSSPSEAS